jgi:hypothetical protein
MEMAGGTRLFNRKTWQSQGLAGWMSPVALQHVAQDTSHSQATMLYMKACLHCIPPALLKQFKQQFRPSARTSLSTRAFSKMYLPSLYF